MGVTEKIKNLPSNVGSSLQTGAKKVTHSVSHILLRAVSAFFIGLVVGLIFQELFKLGTLSLVFLMVLFFSLIYKELSKFSLFQIIVFDVICVLIGALLRMYILIAPN